MRHILHAWKQTRKFAPILASELHTGGKSYIKSLEHKQRLAPHCLNIYSQHACLYTQSIKQPHLMLSCQLENRFEHSVHIDPVGLRDLRCPGTHVCTSPHDGLETVATMSASLCDTSGQQTHAGAFGSCGSARCAAAKFELAT